MHIDDAHVGYLSQLLLYGIAMAAASDDYHFAVEIQYRRMTDGDPLHNLAILALVIVDEAF